MSLFARHNPATGELVWQGRTASKEEIERAFRSAQEQQIGWSQLCFSERQRILETFQQNVEKHKESLAIAISQETGKPLWDARNEIQAVINKVPFTLQAYSLRASERSVEQGSAQGITRHRPLGVGVVLGPFNFPAHIPHGHILPALLMGNTLLWKPSPYTPKTSELLMELWQHSGLPPGVLQLLQGDGQTGAFLVEHKAWDFLAYTGSSHVGHQILKTTHVSPEKLVALEMGGNNALIVGSIQDPIASAYAIIQSAFLSSGQRCTCARRLVVWKQDTTELLIKTLIDWTRSLSIGPYTDVPEPFMGPLITQEAADSILAAQEMLIDQGGVSLLKAERLPLGKNFISPAIVDVTAISEREDREWFGPLLQVVYVHSLEEAIREANKTRYGLVAGILTDVEKEYRQFFQHVKAGLINWNMPLTGATSAMPFGGIGWSGNYRPSGFYAIDSCCYPVASMESTSLKLPKVLTPGILSKESLHESYRSTN